MADQRPDALDNAYFAGRNASEPDAAAWKERFLADPQDMLARASWIGWKTNQDLSGFLDSVEFREQVLWLVENHPASTLTGLIVPFASGRRDRPLQSELRRLWNAAVEREPKNIAVLESAGHFFGLSDPDRTHELLLAARAISPSDPMKEQALASHWLLQARRYSGSLDEGPLRFEDEFDPEPARRALEHAERAIELTAAGQFNEWYEVTRIEAAAAAGCWTRAEEVAKAALAYVSSRSAGGVTGNVAYHANRILGHAALRRDDVSTARECLLQCCSGGSSPQLGSFGPDWSLARELLERGERDVVLEFLAQCRSIWEGHHVDLDLWKLQIGRGERCTFSRAGLSFRLTARAPGTKSSGGAESDQEPDDRDPTERAYVDGLRAGDDQAQVWAERIEREPEDLNARAAWLGWATRRQGRNQRPPESLRASLEWLIHNRPEHPFTGQACSAFRHGRDPRLEERITGLWLEKTERRDASPAELGNAATYFWGDDSPRALALLARAAELEPRNPRWPGQAAFVHLASGRKVRADARFDAQLDPVACKRALAEAERAHLLARDSQLHHEHMVTHMTAAAGAGCWERASEIAREALRLIPACPILRVRRVYCLTRAHLLLGLAALRRGDRAEAQSELRESVACFAGQDGGFFPPNALLALELLALGDRDAMFEFLESSRAVRPNEQSEIDLWQKVVRSGGTPEMSFLWVHL